MKSSLPAAQNFGSGRWPAAIAAAAVLLTYAWIVSAGHLFPWPAYSDYYDRLATAFAHGQTSLLERPSARLLALPDPYDPAQNEGLRLHDAVLWKGRYYLYWGPVPAILLTPLKWLGAGTIGDQYIVFAFAAGTLLLSAAMLVHLRRRFFPSAPAWTLGLAILVAGLATPMPYLLARSAIYEAAIMAGQFFLLAGLFIAIAGFDEGRPSGRRLALASACWGLAVASRASLLPAVGGLVILAAWRLCARQGPRARWRLDLPRLTGLIMPLLLTGVLLGAYNLARFGSWSEFGQKYQLAGFNLRALPPGRLFSSRNVWPAMYSYLFRPVFVSPEFPFVRAIGGASTYPRFVPLPPEYEADEPISGLLFVSPVLLLCFLAAFEARPGTAPPARQRQPGESSPRWVMICLLSAAALGFAPAPFLIGSTMRYLADLTPLLMLFMICAMWRAAENLRDRPSTRRRLHAVFAGLGFVSICIGLLLGMTGYHDHFSRHNPALFRRLSHVL